MKTSFFQDQKWILSENPYATEDQSHRTVSRTSKPGLKPWKNSNAVLQNFILIKLIFRAYFQLQLETEISVTNIFNSFNF